jgi:hypothetical protein
MKSITMKEAVEVLKADACDCGRRKDRMKVFCRGCFARLPWALKSRLYDKIGAGFEQAVADAREYLKGE